MAKSLLPAKITKQVKQTVYQKADEHGYGSRTRTDNSAFIDSLVADHEVGSVLKDYLAKEDIRTYIKDSILNAYAKKRSGEIFGAKPATDTIRQIYGTETSVIQKHKDNGKTVSVCKAEDGKIFIVSEGTVIKWETALRKALEIIARKPGLTINGVTPSICLHLADISASMTDGDKKHIITALAAISVKTQFGECDLKVNTVKCTSVVIDTYNASVTVTRMKKE